MTDSPIIHKDHNLCLDVYRKNVNGFTSVEIIPSLTPTRPYSRASDTRHDLGMLFVNMYAASPEIFTSNRRLFR